MTYADYKSEFEAFWEDEDNDMEIDSWTLTSNGSELLAAYGYLNSLTVTEVEDWWPLAEEAFAGTYPSDEAFAREFAEGDEQEMPWPYNNVDWEAAAADLMQDYSTEAGFYFRNL